MATLLSASVQTYVGKTVDLLAFDNAKATGEALLSQQLVLPGQSGALIAGIEKLVQRFLLELLTERGSLIYDPSRGTFFMTRIRAGFLRTSQDLFSEFSTAEVELRNVLRLEEADTDPPDERYANATLLSADLSGDTATLQIQVSSQAGTSRKVIYPLRVTAI
jgi:hypothetical protein